VLDQLGEIELPPLFHNRYNIAPTQKVALIRSTGPKHVGECIWGFKNPKPASAVINARSETLADRPMFKSLLATNRCLIPADGFYEWKGKQPYYFQTPGKQLFAFAGLWRNDRCVILTRAADTNMQGIHHRMPIILLVEQWNPWLSNVTSVSTAVETDVTPSLRVRCVSRRVNAVANDNPACLAPSDEQTELSLFPNGE